LRLAAPGFEQEQRPPMVQHSRMRIPCEGPAVRASRRSAL